MARRTVMARKQLLVLKPKPARPAKPELDTRTPSGRILPY
jgi:hypothetical protein